MAIDLLARLYDPVMYLPERMLLRDHREYLVADVSGTVLDLGAGTGALFPYFAEEATNGELTVHAIEPDESMRTQAHERLHTLDLSAELVDARAESLPYSDNTFDYVIASLVFCTIPDIESAFDEVARVLKPGGEFRFLEHVRGSGTLGTLHDTVAPAWFHVAGGCTLNQETGRLFQHDGRFELLEYERFEDGLTKAVPLIRGRLKRRQPSVRDRLSFG